MTEPTVPERWRVKRAQRESYDTVTLELEPTDSERSFTFTAGQFNMIYVFGVGEVPVSISGHLSNPFRLVHTIRAVGAVTRGLCHLKAGAVVGIRGPFGSHWPLDVAIAGDVVILAGGIGVVPLRPAVRQLLAQRQAYKRIAFLYGARTPGDLLYLQELKRWRSRFDLGVEITVDSASVDWRGNVGVVTTLLARVAFESNNTMAMVCGPEIMMRFAVRALRQRGVADEKIFLSMERNMKCAVGWCGHCQFGPTFVCQEGPVFAYSRIKNWFAAREI